MSDMKIAHSLALIGFLISSLGTCWAQPRSVNSNARAVENKYHHLVGEFNVYNLLDSEIIDANGKKAKGTPLIAAIHDGPEHLTYQDQSFTITCIHSDINISVYSKAWSGTPQDKISLKLIVNGKIVTRDIVANR
ncbi:hypothetical protein QD460_17335 [Rhizobium jaguaris]